MTLDQIIAWLNATYPDRDWNQWCQRLMWNVVHVVSGTPEKDMAEQPTATIARLNSHIESTDPNTAPLGAFHYFLYPADGHVGMSLGGARVLMTGTKEALGKGGVLLGTNYGVTTVPAYVAAKKNKYLGWSRTNGKNPSIIGKITGEDDMSAKAEQQIEAVYAALFGPANLGVPKTTWARPFGEKPGEAYYGLFDVAIRTQELVVTQQGQIAALTNLVEQLSKGGSGGVINMKSVTEAAERGARDALDGLTLKATA